MAIWHLMQLWTHHDSENTGRVQRQLPLNCSGLWLCVHSCSKSLFYSLGNLIRSHYERGHHRESAGIHQ